MTNNTADSFFSKWKNNPSLAFKETVDENSEIRNWILSRNGFRNGDDLQQYLKDKKNVLDAGCGNGRVTALLRLYAPESCRITGIDLVASEIAKENFAGIPNTFFYSKDLLADLSDLGKFDFIYCQEVLHHTNDPKRAFLNLVTLLEKEGEVAIYVYKKKAPMREYADDYIRGQIAGLSYEDAMKVCYSLTQLGKDLHDSGIKVNVPAVEILGIEKGEYDLQRFIYHFFLKCFWNDQFNFHDNAVINYDWYHPQNCTRHTFDEIEGWFNEAGLEITQSFVDFYGITMRGKKK